MLLYKGVTFSSFYNSVCTYTYKHLKIYIRSRDGQCCKKPTMDIAELGIVHLNTEVMCMDK